ncbi:MAG: DUF523 domain-containing protein [Candidatus Aenigmatarchaeota archaeon]
MKLVSACLIGCKCRYNGKDKANDKVLELMKTEVLVPICPEVLAGLGTPREPTETNGTGGDVLAGKAKALTKTGNDVSTAFIDGAEETLKIAKTLNITEAILKQHSPSCGYGSIPNGKFDGRTEGIGVTAALLKQNDFKIITEEDL